MNLNTFQSSELAISLEGPRCSGRTYNIASMVAREYPGSGVYVCLNQQQAQQVNRQYGVKTITPLRSVTLRGTRTVVFVDHLVIEHMARQLTEVLYENARLKEKLDLLMGKKH